MFGICSFECHVFECDSKTNHTNVCVPLCRLLSVCVCLCVSECFETFQHQVNLCQLACDNDTLGLERNTLTGTWPLCLKLSVKPS